jgi:hypothetical protein
VRLVIRFYRFVRHSTLTTAIAVVALVLSTNGRANASCGDYVTIGGKKQMMPHDSDAKHLPAAPKSPCHGPNCSRAPILPPAAAAPVAPIGIDDSLQAVLLQGNIDVPRSEWRSTEPEARPFHIVGSIFHPPRV